MSTSEPDPKPITSSSATAPSAEPVPEHDPLREGALIALAAAESVGTMTASIASDPLAKAGGMIAAMLSRIIAKIVEAHGAAGAAAAKELLEKLHADGPQGVTDAQIADDDAKLLEEIRGWYGVSTTKPPPTPYDDAEFEEP